MANNLFTGPNGAVATADIAFSDAGFNSGNCAKIILIDPTGFKSWVPGRTINGIAGLVRDKSYYITMLSNGDFTASLVPPLPSSAQLATPGSFAATAGNAQVSLSWAAVTNATGYTVERATDSGFTANVSTVYTGSATNTVDTGRTNGTLYYYRVKATAVGYSNSAYASGSATPTSGVSYLFDAEFAGSNGTALSSYTPEVGTIPTITGSPTLNGSGALSVPASANFKTANVSGASNFTARLGFTSIPDGAQLFAIADTGTSGKNAYLSVTRSGSNFNAEWFQDDAYVLPEAAPTVIAVSNVKELILIKTGNSLVFKYKDGSNADTVLGTTIDVTGYSFNNFTVVSVGGSSVIDYLRIT